MASPLPRMSPIRTFAGGEIVPPASEPTPIAITHPAEELAANHRRTAEAKAQQEAFVPTPVRLWVNGVLQAVPQQQPSVPPEQTLERHRLVVEGAELAEPAKPLLDPRQARQQALEQARAKNMADAARGTRPTAEGQHIPYTPEERAQQQRLENQYARCASYCLDHHLAVLPTEAEFYAGNLIFKDH
jgi:hypothetical protein